MIATLTAYTSLGRVEWTLSGREDIGAEVTAWRPLAKGAAAAPPWDISIEEATCIAIEDAVRELRDLVAQTSVLTRTIPLDCP